MADKFNSHSESLTSPPADLISVTPDDAQDLPFASRALNVAQSGTVRVTTVAGTTGTITVAAGIMFPVRITRVWATGTSADGVVALF